MCLPNGIDIRCCTLDHYEKDFYIFVITIFFHMHQILPVQMKGEIDIESGGDLLLTKCDNSLQSMEFLFRDI